MEKRILVMGKNIVIEMFSSKILLKIPEKIISDNYYTAGQRH